MARTVYDLLNQSLRRTAAPPRFSGSIVCANSSRTVEQQFSNAFITSVTFPACKASKDIANFTVTFAPEGCKEILSAGSDRPSNLSDKSTGWYPAYFRLEIDGLDCRYVSEIDAFTVDRRIASDTIGEMRAASIQTGSLRIPNLRLTMSERGIESWKRWADEFIRNGMHTEKEGRLIYLSQDLTRELARVNFHQLGIIHLEHMMADRNSDALAKYVVELYCTGLDLVCTGVPTANTMANTTPEPAPAGAAANTVEAAQPPTLDGKMGEVYALRKDDPLHFSLKRAEYTTALVRTGDQYTVPRADNKLLVLHFTLQNPGTREQLVRFDTLQFGAFDAANVVHAAQGSWGIESTHAPLETSLQPGQKIEGYTTIIVPAKGAISRLRVASGGADPLLGYDLRSAENKVAALPAPIADPNDGATARALVPGALNANYPYEQFTAIVEKFEYTTTSLLDEAPPEGGRYLVCTFLVKNVSTQSAILRFDTFAARCISEEGEEMRYGNALLLATTNRKLEQSVRPGEELRARIYFAVPKGAVPKSMILRQGESREYRFPVGSGTRELEVPRITLPGG